jgi:hypothetical protein
LSRLQELQDLQKQQLKLKKAKVKNLEIMVCIVLITMVGLLNGRIGERNSPRTSIRFGRKRILYWGRGILCYKRSSKCFGNIISVSQLDWGRTYWRGESVSKRFFHDWKIDASNKIVNEVISWSFSAKNKSTENWATCFEPITISYLEQRIWCPLLRLWLPESSHHEINALQPRLDYSL